MSDHKPTILVIDDEPPIRKLLRMGLATQGYDIAEATNGRTAIEALSRVTPDLVILDLGLPDTAGGDLLRRIRADHETASILVLSSRDDERTKVDALDSGADDYMTKPFGMNELLARIRAGVAAPSARPRRASDLPGRRTLGRSHPTHRPIWKSGHKAVAEGI